ncbi:MAG: BMP family ABC transporter substrate-binding protein, partial [Thermoanaerobaculales bacterium]|nr:BMP family ABC transporter substrate-binding protein [Thermoanaerobaculales bacterium]
MSPLSVQPIGPRRVAVAVAITLVASGCGPPHPAEPGFRVRLLTSGPLSGRWEREAERGLGLLAAELGADVSRVRAAGAGDLRVRLRAQAADGVDLIFCVGPEVEPVVFTEAAAFPDTDFVTIPGNLHGPNQASIAFLPEEAGYLAGALAASLADEPLIGLLRGAGRPWLERLETGFVAGFRATRPETGRAVLDRSRRPGGPRRRPRRRRLADRDRPGASRVQARCRRRRGADRRRRGDAAGRPRGPRPQLPRPGLHLR